MSVTYLRPDQGQKKWNAGFKPVSSHIVLQSALIAGDFYSIFAPAG